MVEPDFWMFNFYLMEVFSQVSPLPWFNMLKTSPLSDVSEFTFLCFFLFLNKKKIKKKWLLDS